MELISFTRGLVDNIGVKLIALVVALVIWFNASGQQQVNKTYVASLSFVNVPDSLTLVGRLPGEVEISVSGTRRELLFLGFRRVNMMVNMARATEGRFTQRLSVSDLLLPPGVEPGDVRIMSPLSVNVALERLVSKRMRVAVVLANSLSGSQMLARVPEARPMWVKVTGPESAVTALDRLPTTPIDLSKIKESITREVAIDYDADLLTVVPDRVVISVAVSERIKRVLANVPPTILLDNKEYITEISPKTVSLTLEGPKALLDTLSSGDVSVLIDLSGKPPGRYTLAPEIIVPDGVEKYAMDIDSLRILVRGAPNTGSLR